MSTPTKRGITVIERMLAVDRREEEAAIVHSNWTNEARRHRHGPHATGETIDPLPSWPTYPVLIQIRSVESA